MPGPSIGKSSASPSGGRPLQPCRRIHSQSHGAWGPFRPHLVKPRCFPFTSTGFLEKAATWSKSICLVLGLAVAVSRATGETFVALDWLYLRQLLCTNRGVASQTRAGERPSRVGVARARCGSRCEAQLASRDRRRQRQPAHSRRGLVLRFARLRPPTGRRESLLRIDAASSRGVVARGGRTRKTDAQRRRTLPPTGGRVRRGIASSARRALHIQQSNVGVACERHSLSYYESKRSNARAIAYAFARKKERTRGGRKSEWRNVAQTLQLCILDGLFSPNELVEEAAVKIVADRVVDEALLGGRLSAGLIAEDHVIVPAALLSDIQRGRIRVGGVEKGIAQ